MCNPKFSNLVSQNLSAGQAPQDREPAPQDVSGNGVPKPSLCMDYFEGETQS